MGGALDALDGHWSEEGGEKGRELGLSRERRRGFHPQIIDPRTCHCYWRLKGSRRSCGKKWRSWRLVEVVKNGILVKWQKVFDACLVKQMIYIWHVTPQGEMSHIIRAFYQF